MDHKSEQFNEFDFVSKHPERFIREKAQGALEFEEVLKDPQGSDRRRVHDKEEVRNYRWIYISISLIFLTLIFRSAYLQIVEGEQYRGLAEGNRIRSVVQTAPRGILYDRNNEQLVENVPSYYLAIIPSDIPLDDAKRKELFKELAKKYELKSQELEDLYQKQDKLSFDPIVFTDITRDQALQIESSSKNYHGINIIVQATRLYDIPEALSHIVGFVGKLSEEEIESHPDYDLTDFLGKTGIEQSYESVLRGENGAKNIEVDAYGQIVNVLATKEPIAGSDIVLSIDKGLQEKLYTTLVEAAKRSGENRAAAVAVNPQNGEILAMASVPGYDVNVISQNKEENKIKNIFSDPNQPLFNRTIGGTYPPGSTFKPFVATGALEKNKITRDTTFFDTGLIEVGGQEFKGWKPGGHGTVNVISAIAHSVNGFFYSIGGGYGEIDGLGIQGIDEIASAFGFGKETSIDLESEQNGLLPAPEWKQVNYDEDWFLGDTYNASIGQGFVLVTPLQLANATAAIANGGTLWWPHLGKKILYNDGSKKEIESKVLNEKVASSKNINIVREGMRETITSGTGQLLKDLPVSSAGKTGTAQFGTGEPNAWFTAFAPYEKPEIALAILVEEAGEGSDYSAPVARDVLQYYFTR